MLSFGPQCPWYEAYERFGPPTIKYCEERLCALINEPYYSWSNLAYIFAALLILLRSKTLALRFLGGTIFFMGLASFVYHATNNLLSQFGDYLGMFTFVCLILTFNFKRGGKLLGKSFGGTYLAFIVFFILVLYLFYSFGIHVQAVIASIGVFIIMTEYFLRKKSYSYRWYFVALGLFATGELFSILDATGILCFARAPFFNGHNLWHLAGGFGTYFIYLFYSQFKEL